RRRSVRSMRRSAGSICKSRWATEPSGFRCETRPRFGGVFVFRQSWFIGFGWTPRPAAGGIAFRASRRPALARAQYIHVLLVAIPPAAGHGSLQRKYRLFF